MKTGMTREQLVFYWMAVVGGFMGGFAVLRCGVMGAAQTTNLLSLIIALVGNSWLQVLQRLFALLLYIGAMSLARWIDTQTKYEVRLISMAVDGICILIIGLLPEETEAIYVLYPVFFMLAFQWLAFPGANGNVSASIFSTNNLRQVVVAVTDYCTQKDRSQLQKAVFYLGTLLHFHVGVAASVLLIHWGGYRTIWLLLPLLAVNAAVLEAPKLQLVHRHREAVVH